MRDGLFRGSGGVSLRAAQYLRMSTDEQDYSTLNQAEAIAGYAAAHNIEVVRTYSDDARSGLQLNGRPGLKLLLSDVEAGKANFDVILVYDVSRWGRFRMPMKVPTTNIFARSPAFLSSIVLKILRMTGASSLQS